MFTLPQPDTLTFSFIIIITFNFTFTLILPSFLLPSSLHLIFTLPQPDTSSFTFIVTLPSSLVHHNPNLAFTVDFAYIFNFYLFRVSGYEMSLLGYTPRLQPLIRKAVKENKDLTEVISFGKPADFDI